LLYSQRAKARIEPVPAGHFFLTLSINNETRRCLVHIPSQYDKNKPMPLVLMLHGMGGSAMNSFRETGWSAKADTEGFLIAYPEATRPDASAPPSLKANPPAWNDGSGRFHAAERNTSDVSFLRDLIKKLTSEYAIDPKRVFITGFSNGASMALRAGAELSDCVAAIAPHSGACWLETVKPASDISVCYITGTEDSLNPMEGGFPKLAMNRREQGGKPKPPVLSSISTWTKALGCTNIPTFDETDNGVRTRRFGPGRNGATVELITIAGMGHHWAGGVAQAPEMLVGKSSNKLKATDAVWKFFRQHPKP
jgi:polyhydroxybutyrate depolymerase